MKLYEKLISQSKLVEDMKQKLSKKVGKLSLSIEQKNDGIYVRLCDSFSYNTCMIDISIENWENIRNAINEMLNKETEIIDKY